MSFDHARCNVGYDARSEVSLTNMHIPLPTRSLTILIVAPSAFFVFCISCAGVTPMPADQLRFFCVLYKLVDALYRGHCSENHSSSIVATRN